jgi:hypothetical protein
MQPGNVASRCCCLAAAGLGSWCDMQQRYSLTQLSCRAAPSSSCSCSSIVLLCYSTSNRHPSKLQLLLSVCCL